MVRSAPKPCTRANTGSRRRWCLGFRVGLLVHPFQFFNGVVGINLRGSEARMTQQFLDGIQVGPAVRQVRGERMAEYVGAALFDGRHVR